MKMYYCVIYKNTQNIFFLFYFFYFLYDVCFFCIIASSFRGVFSFIHYFDQLTFDLIWLSLYCFKNWTSFKIYLFFIFLFAKRLFDIHLFGILNGNLIWILFFSSFFTLLHIVSIVSMWSPIIDRELLMILVHFYSWWIWSQFSTFCYPKTPNRAGERS